MEEKFELSMIVNHDDKGYLILKNFDALSDAIKDELYEGPKFQTFICQTQDDYKTAKEKRAFLNSVAKTINDTKIRYIKDATDEFTFQCKSLCNMISEKALEFDTEAKKYEIKELNKEVKLKQGSFDISIHCNTKEELEQVRKVLDDAKFIKYVVKEN